MKFILIIFDELVKSPKLVFSVIPANPGSGPGQAPESSLFQLVLRPLDSGFHRSDDFLRDHQFLLF